MPSASMRGRRIPTTRIAGWMAPMLATLVESLDDGRGWVFERKLDGIRTLAYRDGPSTRLYSRNKLPLEDAFPSIADAVSRLDREHIVLDGEVVAMVGGRVGGFEALQQRTMRTPLRYYVFDVLSVDGDDVRELPLLDRKQLLKDVGLTGPLKRTAHRTGDPEQLRGEACASGWEGVIAKRVDAGYRAGRSRDWLKLKCVLEQELVVGGYTDPKGSREGFGALLVGYYTDGGLHYAGEVGTGFTAKTLLELAGKLSSLDVERSPFHDYPKATKGQHFVKPKLVAQVGFSEWTRDGKLRHPRFLGLRTDKRPADVVRERPS
jgi:bifunctional non-homologous end joining protein LigD